MQHIQPPTVYRGDQTSVFLAGSAGGQTNWRLTAVELLRYTQLIVLDPFVSDFPKNDPRALEARTQWEYDHLRRATLRLFWFPSDALGMISLYELGTCTTMEVPLLVGVDPGYRKRSQIVTQLRVARPDVSVLDRLDELVQQVIVYAQHPAGDAIATGRR